MKNLWVLGLLFVVFQVEAGRVASPNQSGQGSGSQSEQGQGLKYAYAVLNVNYGEPVPAEMRFRGIPASLGTVLSVQVDSIIRTLWTVGVENTSPEEISFTTLGTHAVLDLDFEPEAESIFEVATEHTPVQAMIPGPYDGVTDFGGASGRTFDDLEDVTEFSCEIFHANNRPEILESVAQEEVVWPLSLQSHFNAITGANASLFSSLNQAIRIVVRIIYL